MKVLSVSKQKIIPYYKQQNKRQYGPRTLLLQMDADELKLVKDQAKFGSLGCLEIC